MPQYSAEVLDTECVWFCTAPVGRFYLTMREKKVKVWKDELTGGIKAIHGR